LAPLWKSRLAKNMASISKTDGLLEQQLRQACAELERCLRGGSPCTTEDLLKTYPALASHSESALELIYTEHVLREELGQRPSPAEWQMRFPQWQQDLQELFQVHALADDSASDTDLGQRPTLPGTEGLARSTRKAHSPWVGSYELLGEVARGGMGLVYKARHAKLNRIVALKMMLGGPQAGPAELARFRKEAEAAARLQHPNIVQIYEIGEQDGRPFLALEFIDGGSLADKVAGKPQPARAAAELVETLARAIHHAHQRGVIHRDLKPANVLLQIADGSVPADKPATDSVPSAICSPRPAIPKITDFGLAKRFDEAGTHSRSGAIVGTPGYMSPEQARGDAEAIGPPTDVYGLGAILYELLTGRPPFQAAHALDTLEQVCTQEPVPPSRLYPRLPRDLETICLKCLQKESRKRYGNAEALAEDLRRFMAGEPIQARPIGAVERTGRWCRRNPLVAGLLAGLFLTCATGFFAVTWKWFDAERERAKAVTAEIETAAEVRAKQRALERAETSLYFHRIALAHHEWLRNSVGRTEELLDECPADQRHWEWYYLKRLCHSDLRTLPPLTMAKRAQVSPDAGRFVAIDLMDSVLLCDTNVGANPATLDRSAATYKAVGFSCDSRHLALVTWTRRTPGEGRVYDTATAQVVLTLQGPTGAAYGIAFSPDGKLLALGGYKVVTVWDVSSGAKLRTLEGYAEQVTTLAFSPDSRHLASASAETLRICDARTGRELHTLTEKAGSITALAFCPTGKRFATASTDRTVKVWDAGTGQLISMCRGHADPAYAMSFSPDGSRLASAGGDRIVRIWEPETGVGTLTFRGHVAHIASLVYSLDGRRLTSMAADCSVKVWDVTRDQTVRVLVSGSPGGLRSIAFDPRAEVIAGATSTGTIRLWQAKTGREIRTLSGSPNADYLTLAWHPDHVRLASAGRERMVRVWDTQAGQELLALGGHSSNVLCVAFSPDGRWLASAGMDKTLRFWDATTGLPRGTALEQPGVVRCLAFSPDSQFIALGGSDGIVRLLDMASSSVARTLPSCRSELLTVQFSPDGRHLAAGTRNGTLRLWGLNDESDISIPGAHPAWIRSLAYHPTGLRLASAGDDGSVKIWDAGTGQNVLTVVERSTRSLGLAFTADGNWLTGADAEGNIRAWDATPLQAQSADP
jgi:WD40 repeat protein